MTDGQARLDRWLWAARFFKTRGLAQVAVAGGRVHVNGQRAKPARPLKPGDRLEISRGEERIEVVVRGLAERRGPATVARTLYGETADSLAARAARAEARRLAPGGTGPRRRPDKRDRRRLIRLGRLGPES
jgi:ribosome-associated heat shock protein Hsp15